MKIRSFKGPSLERIYEAIQREMGDDAVIINTTRPSVLKGIVPSFLRGEQHEVIAVASDDAGDRHAVARLLESEGIRHLSEVSAEKLTVLEKELLALRAEIRGMSRGGLVGVSPDGDTSVPEFAARWDPRFIGMLLERYPDFWQMGDSAARRAALASLIPACADFPLKGEDGPHVIALTGPTGAGKTTTLAKLAARWSLGARLKVGVITTDTYRVAAVDQIREYAVLLGLELKIAFSAAETARAIRAFADKDVILIDTVGRSQHDESGLKALHGILNGVGRCTTLLLIPATWERCEVPGLIGNFRSGGLTRLVITKLDETRRHDVLTFAAAEEDMPIVFLTNGQRVPQDLHEARAAEMAALLAPNRENSN